MALPSLALPPRYADPKLVGRGGMADIYAADDTELGRRVAVKVLSERFAHDPDIRERFKREALAAARLSGHPNIATIFDVGETEDRPFIVMELVDGGNLADRIEGAPQEQALAWLGQAASALDAAHAEGIVHRDVKPSNMLLDRQDDLKITDFGIALVIDEAAAAVTATGTVLGTAGYLAPEQAAGQRATAESDIYALGVVAYELLTGTRPFARTSVAAEAAAHLNEPVEPPSERAGLPRQVDPVFARALAKDPSYRYRSAAEFVRDLSAALGGEEVATPPPAAAGAATEVTRVAGRPLRRRRPLRFLPVAGAALLLAGGALAAVLLTHSQSPASGGTRPATQPRHRPVTHSTPAPVVNPVAPPAPPGKAKGHPKPKKHGKAKGHKGPLGTGPGTTTSPGTTQATITTSPTTTLATTTAAVTTATTGTTPLPSSTNTITTP